MDSRPDPPVVDPHAVAVGATVVRCGEFEDVYRRTDRDVRRYVLALTRSADDADDIVAEL